MKLFGGSWHVSKRGISMNEGGYLAGLHWSWAMGFFDLWFKAPICGARSFRISALGTKLVIGLR